MHNHTMQAPGKAVAAFFLALALIGAGGLLASRSAAAADEKKKDTVSRELAKPLKAAQDDIQAKKYSDALAKIKEADGNPKKTPFDEHVINQLERHQLR